MPRSFWIASVGVLVLAEPFDALIAVLLGERATVLPEVPVARLPLLVVFAAAAVLLAGDRRAALASVRASWPLWPALALAVASTAWSDQPARTLLWALALLGTTAFGVALDSRFAARMQAVLAAGVISGIAVCSIGAALLFTTNKIGRGGLWSGVYLQKNLLGRVLALGVSATGVTLANEPRRGTWLALLLLCGGVLVFSQSVASLLAAAIALAATGFLVAARAYRSAAPTILVAGALTIVAAVLFLIGTKPGLRVLARSDTFNERTRIWRVVTALAGEDPWVGHGYGAFWNGPAGGTAIAALGLDINHAHNGAVDLYAELGIVGLVVVALPIAWTALAAVQHALLPKRSACLWPATYVVFFVASNVAESALLRHKLYWALFVAVVCHLVRCRSAADPARPSR